MRIFNRYTPDMPGDAYRADLLMARLQADAQGLGDLLWASGPGWAREAARRHDDFTESLRLFRANPLVKCCMEEGLRYNRKRPPAHPDSPYEYDLEGALGVLERQAAGVMTNLGVGRGGLEAYHTRSWLPFTVWKQWKRHLKLSRNDGSAILPGRVSDWDALPDVGSAVEVFHTMRGRLARLFTQLPYPHEIYAQGSLSTQVATNRLDVDVVVELRTPVRIEHVLDPYRTGAYASYLWSEFRGLVINVLRSVGGDCAVGADGYISVANHRMGVSADIIVTQSVCGDGLPESGAFVYWEGAADRIQLNDAREHRRQTERKDELTNGIYRKAVRLLKARFKAPDRGRTGFAIESLLYNVPNELYNPRQKVCLGQLGKWLEAYCHSGRVPLLPNGLTQLSRSTGNRFFAWARSNDARLFAAEVIDLGRG